MLAGTPFERTALVRLTDISAGRGYFSLQLDNLDYPRVAFKVVVIFAAFSEIKFERFKPYLSYFRMVYQLIAQ